jgi:hypothetical protein
MSQAYATERYKARYITVQYVTFTGGQLIVSVHGLLFLQRLMIFRDLSWPLVQTSIEARRVVSAQQYTLSTSSFI